MGREWCARVMRYKHERPLCDSEREKESLLESPCCDYRRVAVRRSGQTVLLNIVVVMRRHQAP